MTDVQQIETTVRQRDAAASVASFLHTFPQLIARKNFGMD
jgi:hypothetical protein